MVYRLSPMFRPTLPAFNHHGEWPLQASHTIDNDNTRSSVSLRSTESLEWALKRNLWLLNLSLNFVVVDQTYCAQKYFTRHQVYNITTITVQFSINSITLSSSVRSTPFTLSQYRPGIVCYHIPLSPSCTTPYLLHAQRVLGSHPDSWVFEMPSKVRL